MPDQQDPRTIVRSSQKLWSEEVAIADACEPVPAQPVVYEFAGGRRLFKDRINPYE